MGTASSWARPERGAPLPLTAEFIENSCSSWFHATMAPYDCISPQETELQWPSSSIRCIRRARRTARRSSWMTSPSRSTRARRSASWAPTAWASPRCSRSWPASRRSPTARPDSPPATPWASSSRSPRWTTTRPSSRTSAWRSATSSPRSIASTRSARRCATPIATWTPSWPRWAVCRTRSTPPTAGTSTPSSESPWTRCSCPTPTCR